MKNIFKSAFLYVWFIVVVSLLMMCLMWCVYLIPIEKIRPNVVKSVTQISSLSFSSFHSYKVHKDDFTDILMLNEAVFLGRDPLYDALLNPRVEPMGRWDQGGNLRIGVHMRSLDNIPVIDYARFWHGYLIFLKPLLVFFDLQEIRIINLLTQTMLLFAVLILLCRRLNFRYSLAYFCAILFLNPEIIWQCLEYSIDFNVMLLATLWVLLNQNPNDKYLFFIIGTTTILFDFLTFPLITLGFPLITYICLYERSFRESVKSVVKNSVLWGGGYLCILLAKWILASAIAHQNVILEGWKNVLYRMSAENGESSIMYSSVVELNLAELYHPEILYFWGLFMLGLIINYLIKPYKVKFSSKSLVVLGVGLMPFIWYGMLLNHSFVHHFMTYRILAITVYGILASAVCNLKSRDVYNGGD